MAKNKGFLSLTMGIFYLVVKKLYFNIKKKYTV